VAGGQPPAREGDRRHGLRLKAGAFDYLTKPVDLRQFRAVVASAMGRTRATPPPPPTDAAPADGRGDPLRRLVGNSDAMTHVRSLVEKVARSMAPVLVQGESGTGKELVARAIHDVSARAGQPFVAVNCGAIPETLLEAEFFGVRKGAFTGANVDRDGFFQAANGGTLFLDEIGDLPFAMQSKLLRAIQERAVRAIGATTEQTMNVRIVSATHKDLAAEVQAGRFRQDLFYRLNVIDIRVPPLRERLVDLPAIADALLARLAREAGVSPPPRLASEARALLARYAFPGNVRELENLLHRAVALSDGDAISGADLALPEALLADAAMSVAPVDPEVGVIAAVVTDHAADGLTVAEVMGAGGMVHAHATPPAAQEPVPDDLVRYLDEVERVILVRALERQNFNRTAAGASLGLSLRQMRYRMARLGITESETSDPM
jgi:two-component system response regulator PilR (NtrC family)